MSSDASYILSAPRRITASNLPLPSQRSQDDTAEPGVEVKIDTLEVQSLLGGNYRRAVVSTNSRIPTTNDGHGDIALDAVPGAGIVLPGGLHTYYLDIAPNTEGALHRTTSTDYVIVLSGQLSLLTPESDTYDIVEGKVTGTELVETVAHPGDVIVQRGPIHSLSNRTNDWVRAMCIVLGSEPNKVSIEGSNNYRQLGDAWLA